MMHDKAATSRDAIRHQAALWFIELQSDGSNAELHARWQTWYEAAPEHREAWSRLEAFGNSLGRIPPQVARSALAPSGGSRRRALKAFGVLLAVGGTAWLARESTQQLPILLAEHRTGPGERREIELSDGSRIHLNVDTALDIRFDAQGRRLVLHSGEIHIVTAKDTARPFFVDTPHGRARAIGTRYTVRSDATTGDHTQVAVLEGQVALEPAQAHESGRLLLSAGRQARFSTHEVAPPASVRASDAAWTRGILVAEDQPLPAFIAELARLSGQPLHCDPALDGLKVSGTYPLADPQAILQLLARALPIRIEQQRRWWGGSRTNIHPA